MPHPPITLPLAKAPLLIRWYRLAARGTYQAVSCRIKTTGLVVDGLVKAINELAAQALPLMMRRHCHQRQMPPAGRLVSERSVVLIDDLRIAGSKWLCDNLPFSLEVQRDSLSLGSAVC